MYGHVSTDLEQKHRIGKSMLTFEFQVFNPFKPIESLVTQNCLVNLKDVIPGLKTEFCKLP